MLTNERILTLTAANDTCLNVWLNNQLLSSETANHFAFDIKLIASPNRLFGEKIIALVASSDSFVHLFAIDTELRMTKIIKLAGHHEWVRSLDFVFQNEGKQSAIQKH